MSELADSYRTSFRTWEQRASVRAKPRRVLERADDCLYFPPELVPVANHPLVAEGGPPMLRSLLTQRLHIYLNFTTELEQIAVNPVTQRISRRKLGLDLPDDMVADAYKICTDESWHAQFTDDLSRQVAGHTGIASFEYPEPNFLRRLGELEAVEPAEIRGLTALFFTIVSETLISAILADIPNDDRIVPAVRATVADHAEDEARHHTYFSGLFRRVWPALDDRQRRLIGPMLPELVVAFLHPDRAALRVLLEGHGLSREEASGVVEESYPQDRVDRDARAAARASLRLFRGVGMLDDARTHDAFAARGLLDRADDLD